MIELVDIYGGRYSDETVLAALYELLAAREPHVNISHKVMPTWEQHVAFVGLDDDGPDRPIRPYKNWWLIVHKPGADVSDFLGACYLSKNNEIGIQIFKGAQRQGYGSAALKKIIAMHPGHRLLANIAPMNDDSASLFHEHGFGLIQCTYELDVPR